MQRGPSRALPSYSSPLLVKVQLEWTLSPSFPDKLPVLWPIPDDQLCDGDMLGWTDGLAGDAFPDVWSVGVPGLEHKKRGLALAGRVSVGPAPSRRMPVSSISQAFVFLFEICDSFLIRFLRLAILFSTRQEAASFS